MKAIIKGLRLAAGAVLVAGVMSTAAQADGVRIGIAQFGPHPQLDAVVTAFKAELAAAGYKEGQNTTYDYAHVNFDPSLVPQLLTKQKAGNPDLILTITTPVSQGAKQLLKGSKIPVVFAAVTDPVAAKLVPSWDKGAPDMTGASDLQSLDGVLAFTRKLLPKAKRIGVPFNPGEDNDVAMLGMMKAIASKYGFTVVDVGVDNANDIPVRISSLRGKADVIYVAASNLLQPAVPAVASAANAIRVPVINAAEGPVRENLVLGSFAVDYSQVGKNAGKIAVRILKGTSPADIAPVKPAYADHAPLISAKQMKMYGVTLSGDLANCGCVVQ